jgi:hypothetical protein
MIRVKEEHLIDVLRNVNFSLEEVGKIRRDGRSLMLKVFHDQKEYEIMEGSQREQYFFLRGFQLLSYLHKPAILIRYGVKELKPYNPADFGRIPDTKGLKEYLERRRNGDDPSIKEFAHFLKFGFSGWDKEEKAVDKREDQKGKPVRRKR